MGRGGVKYRWILIDGKSQLVAIRRKRGYKLFTDYINSSQAKDCKHKFIANSKEVKCKKCPFGFTFKNQHPYFTTKIDPYALLFNK